MPAFSLVIKWSDAFAYQAMVFRNLSKRVKSMKPEEYNQYITVRRRPQIPERKLP